MNESAKVGAAVAGGYLLGRTKRPRLAITLASLLLGKKLKIDPKALGKEVLAQLMQRPEISKLDGDIRGDLVSAGRAAAATAMNTRMERLADSLQSRTDRLQRQLEGGQSEDEDEDEDDDGDSPDGVEDEYDDDEEEDGDEDSPDGVEDEYDDEEEEDDDEDSPDGVEDEYDDDEDEDEDSPDGVEDEYDEDEDEDSPDGVEDEYDEDEDDDEEEDEPEPAFAGRRRRTR